MTTSKLVNFSINCTLATKCNAIYRFHLQAFRHLYVLASESRLLLSKDVDTNEFCYVPIEIALKANEHHDVFRYQQMAPCILPELNRIEEVNLF